MNNTLIQIKIKQRLNKLASNDYDNIEPWMIVEAFNKAQLEWVRRQIAGTNVRKDGDENSIRRIDDLQMLLVTTELKGTNKDLFFETQKLPENFLEYKRVSALSQPPFCQTPIRIKVYLAEEANADDYLRDEHTKPSLEWAETFCTLVDNKIRIYGGRELHLKEAELTYYRFPRAIEIAGSINLNTGEESITDVECEFKDDIVELLIDETCAILAADIESFNQVTRAKQSAETNN